MLPHFTSSDRTLIRTYFLRSYPMIFGTLNILIIEAFNTIMISRLGMHHIASAVFANTLFNIFKKINIGFSIAVALLVARANRKKNYNRITQILQHALLLNTLLAIIFFIILICLSSYIKSAHQSPDIFTLGRPYLAIISISLIPAAINNVIRRYVEGLDYAKIGLFIGLCTLLTNILFNSILIYGKCGLPVLGLNGAGIAIALSETLTTVAGLLYLPYVLPNRYQMHLNFPKMSWKYFRKILWISFPVGVQFGLEGLYLLCITMIVGWINVEAQVAHAILLNICHFITIFAVGLGFSSSIFIAQQHNRPNGCLIRQVALTVSLMIGIISILVGLILLTISPYIISVYKPDHDIKCLLIYLIKYLSLFQLFYSICHWGNGILRGLNDRVFSCILNAIVQFMGIVACYLLVVKYNRGISNVWLTLILERMLLSLCLLIRVAYKTKIST